MNEVVKVVAKDGCPVLQDRRFFGEPPESWPRGFTLEENERVSFFPGKEVSPDLCTHLQAARINSRRTGRNWSLTLRSRKRGPGNRPMGRPHFDDPRSPLLTSLEYREADRGGFIFPDTLGAVYADSPVGTESQMPHVELQGSIRCRDVHKSFQPATSKVEGAVVKTRASYLRSDEQEVLLEALVVEGYLKQEFLVQMRNRDVGILIRIYPGTPVQRTDGVKRCLVLLAKDLQKRDSNLSIGTTNLQSFLGGDMRTEEGQ
jgi:hypothetical protein